MHVVSGRWCSIYDEVWPRRLPPRQPVSTRQTSSTPVTRNSGFITCMPGSRRTTHTPRRPRRGTSRNPRSLACHDCSPTPSPLTLSHARQLQRQQVLTSSIVSGSWLSIHCILNVGPHGLDHCSDPTVFQMSASYSGTISNNSDIQRPV
jgi:hypothetical protein